MFFDELFQRSLCEEDFVIISRLFCTWIKMLIDYWEVMQLCKEEPVGENCVSGVTSSKGCLGSESFLLVFTVPRLQCDEQSLLHTTTEIIYFFRL